MNRARVASLLRELASVIEATDDWFSCDNLPPGVSRRTFRTFARTVPGALVDGRTIRVHRTDWYEARAKMRGRPNVPAAPPANDDATFRDLIASGLRPTRKGR